MDRGLYTGALAMIARQFDTDVIANNLANVNTVGFKQDTTVYRDFPAMLLHRLHDDRFETPLHTFDLAPPIGRVGTGVQVDDIITTHQISESLMHTGNPLDMALESIPGVKSSYAFFEIETTQGTRYTRAGQFTVNSEGHLCLPSGALVRTEQAGAPLTIDPNNVEFGADGTIYYNPQYPGGGANMWEDRAVLDKLRIVSFENPRGLAKQGHTLFAATEESGPPQTILFGVSLRTGMLENSNVNPVREMVDLIKSQRAYEASAKVVQTHDTLLGQAVSDVGRVG